jgi:hypothetical protein
MSNFLYYTPTTLFTILKLRYVIIKCKLIDLIGNAANQKITPVEEFIFNSNIL